MFYLSEYLENHRLEYYERLRAISRDDDWTRWCRFFLIAVTEQAIQNEDRARRILEMYDTRKAWIVEESRSQYAIHALDFVFSNPIFSASFFVHESQIPAATARRILGILVSRGLLRTIREASGRRPAVYAFQELLDVAEG
jgi:Fic family protein